MLRERLTNRPVKVTLIRVVILAVNPGGTSTKVAVFRGKRPVFSDNIEHPAVQLAKYKMVLDQYRFRKHAVLDALKRHEVDPGTLNAVVSRGGPLQPVSGGVYRITPRVISDIRQGRVQTIHPSLLGPLVAHELADDLGIEAYFVDPESTDEFWDVARVTGLKGMYRTALSHALSCRTVAREAARRLKKSYERCNFVVAHLGSGFTIAAHLQGRQVDATNANDEGPFSPQRAGSLPLSGIIRVCFSGRYSERDVLDLVQRRGGLASYFGTDDFKVLEALVAKGNKSAQALYDAMVYGIVRHIGGFAVLARGRLDGVIITGGLAKSKRLVSDLRKWVGFLSPHFFVFPGDEEMPALALRLLSALSGEEKVKVYEKEIAFRR